MGTSEQFKVHYWEGKVALQGGKHNKWCADTDAGIKCNRWDQSQIHHMHVLIMILMQASRVGAPLSKSGCPLFA